MLSYLVIGHSHLFALQRGFEFLSETDPKAIAPHFIQLRDAKYRARKFFNLKNNGNSHPSHVNRDVLMTEMAHKDVDAVILMTNGNQHNILGMVNGASMNRDASFTRLRAMMQKSLNDWLEFLTPLLGKPIFVVLPPPPIESIDDLMSLRGQDAETGDETPTYEPAEFRLELWQAQCAITREICSRYRIKVIEMPTSVMNPRGYRSSDCIGKDATHGNAIYGQRVVASAVKTIEDGWRKGAASSNESAGKPTTRDHPYKGLPDHCFWKQSVSELERGLVNPVVDSGIHIRRKEKIATAGSCFAQHISRRLQDNGFNYLCVEDNSLSPYDFSARYGNVYTGRQLLQLIQRAAGEFVPVEKAWCRSDGRYCDPYRPRIHPPGYDCEQDVEEDSRKHLAAVYRMFAELDVFIFTLGLTESWRSKIDGAVFPVAPGVAGGLFDSERHEFVNFRADEVIADMQAFINKLAEINSQAKVILTVSPVPLVATATLDHVVVANSYSKAALRVAADEIVRANSNVFYFPSYEIITSPSAGGAYFLEDKRGIAPDGVDHVMRVFLSSVTELSDASQEGPDSLLTQLGKIEAMLEAECDEALLEKP